MFKKIIKFFLGKKVPLRGFTAAKEGYSIWDNPYDKRKSMIAYKHWNDDWSFYHNAKFH